MAERLNVPPTQSVLLDLRREAAFLEQGYNLLDRKRELLMRLVREQLEHYRQLRKQAHDTLEEAYRWLAINHLRNGGRVLEQAAIDINPAVSIKVRPRSSLGVQYVSVTIRRLELQPISLLWTDTSLDETRTHMADLVVMLAKLGEAETALRRLLNEHRKTQKRVNALKNSIIPSYRETIHAIGAALEEEERSALFQMKVLRESQ